MMILFQRSTHPAHQVRSKLHIKASWLEPRFLVTACFNSVSVVFGWWELLRTPRSGLCEEQQDDRLNRSGPANFGALRGHNTSDFREFEKRHIRLCTLDRDGDEFGCNCFILSGVPLPLRIPTERLHPLASGHRCRALTQRSYFVEHRVRSYRIGCPSKLRFSFGEA